MTIMPESFEDKLIDQDRSSVRCVSDKYAWQNSRRQISAVLEIDVETCKIRLTSPRLLHLCTVVNAVISELTK